jgi:hypothetical protein
LGPQGAARPVRAATWLLKCPPPNCREEISALGRASEYAGPAYGSPMEVEQARSAMRWYDRPSLTSAGNMGAQRALVTSRPTGTLPSNLPCQHNYTWDRPPLHAAIIDMALGTTSLAGATLHAQHPCKFICCLNFVCC